MTAGIEMWHGGHRWEPPFELRPPKSGQAEHGAGLYLCCHRLTAVKYSKGGGNMVHVVLKPNIRWLEDIKVDASVLINAAKSIPRLRARDQIVADIERHARRIDGPISLDILRNLAVNYDAMVGQAAVAISEFLVSQGAEASYYRRTNSDDWVVVFSPQAILRTRVIRANESDSLPYDFPPVEKQMADLSASSAAVAPQPVETPRELSSQEPARAPRMGMA